MKETLTWDRLPSGGLFNRTAPAEFGVRTFTPIELSKMVVVTQRSDFPLLLDLVNATLSGVDVRDMTPPDFEWLMFWHVLSLQNGRYTVPWTSKYGNEVVSTVTWADVRIVRPQLDDEAYGRWCEDGFVASTVRDMEIVTTDGVEDDLMWLYERAQHCVGADFREKIAKLQEIGTDGLRRVHEFKLLALHGVDKFFNLVDTGFNPHVYLGRITLQRNSMRGALGYLTELESIKGVMAAIAELEVEIVQISGALKDGRPVRAEPETVPVDVKAADFVARF